MEFLKNFFAEVGIEHFAVARYENLRVINAQIIEREDFVPKSAILFLVPYYTVTPKNISRYAASLDYHLVIREIGEGLCARLKKHFPSAKMKIYGDHSPIDERHAALIYGLGIQGKNGLLINEEYGSYIFIGELITDIAPEELGESTTSEIRHCYDCGRCQKVCPTGALCGESYDCLSAITQRKGELEGWEIDLMRRYNTAWGCDLCQSVCPYNHDAKKTKIKAFYESPIEELTLDILHSMSKEEFKRRAFAWRGKKVLERNLELLK